MTPPCIIQIKDLYFTYGQDGASTLKGVNLSVRQGERVGLSGANASGKSTLLHVIMGLRLPQAGTVELYGKPRRNEEDFRDARMRMGLLFQDSDDQLFCPTVLDDVAFGPLHLGWGKDAAREAALEALAIMGLQGYEHRVTSRLSAGEKKLVALATNLAMKPDTLLLDEPTSFLDDSSRERLIHVLRDVPVTLLIVSHDQTFLDALTDHRLVLRDGRISDAPTSPGAKVEL